MNKFKQGRWILVLGILLLIFACQIIPLNSDLPINSINESNTYTNKEEVALYLIKFNHLPSNYITKEEAIELGWDNDKGNLWEVSDKKSIGGDRFYNREGLLPTQDNLIYYECDIDYNGGYRNAKRIVYSSNWDIYYTDNHYETFEVLYEGE